MKLSSLERQVAGHAGVPTEDLAPALGCSIEMVRAARDRLGQDLEVGGPRAGHRPRRGVDHLTAEDFDGLMRGNRSVCG